MKPLKVDLTQDYVDGLTIEPGQHGDVSIYDTGRKGLFVRLRRGAGGISKTWYVGYQWRGQDRRKPLGSTDAYTLMDARDRARDVLRDAADGNDPAAVKAVPQDRPTFAEAAEQFIARKLEAFESGKIRRNTFRGYVRYLTGPYFAPLHKIELAKITKVEIVRCINLKREESKSAASQARGSLILLYDFAQRQGWAADGFNPARYTDNPLPRRDAKPRDRTLSDDELVAVWDKAGSLGEYGKIIRLLILLGNRRDEIARMQWDELKDGIWHLPAERTKTGQARRIPLPQAALDLIGERPAGRKHVFGARDSKGFTLWSHEKAKLDEGLLGKLDAPFRLHDLRRTMRSGLTRLGVSRELAEKMIGHIPEKIVRTYEVEEQLGEQAAAFGLWAGYVDGIVSGKVRRIAA